MRRGAICLIFTFIVETLFFIASNSGIRYENHNDFMILKLLEIAENLWSHVRNDSRWTFIIPYLFWQLVTFRKLDFNRESVEH